ncbi:MAG: NAD(P)/FAD-dependent oxidoreductase [Flavobacteriales bacterium]|nr:NAD(P)/FAD-dependent oxidoreductase [Flavobacteriales bacterium]
MKIAVIGGGAAGFMAAVTAKENNPNAHVTIFEKSNKVLSKVLISGGGRCNLTHNCKSISQLIKNYPRGGKELKKSFSQFSNSDTIEWFKKNNIRLKIESDNRMFPESNSSQTIIDLFIRKTEKLNIKICLSSKVDKIQHSKGKISLQVNNKNIKFDRLIISTGGYPKISGFKLFKELGYNISSPVPSLFTFNIPNDDMTKLMGVVVENTSAKVKGLKLKQNGPVLITHWGLSGPCILKLSSWGAKDLADLEYHFITQINWLSENEEFARAGINKQLTSKKNIYNSNPFALPKRLWHHILEKVKIDELQKWNVLNKKLRNRLINTLVNDEFTVNGKTTFKEEFVTCGGITLEQINMKTMESKIHKNIYFSGEVLNMDAVTGGFNFQAAWTTGYLCGKNASK